MIYECVEIVITHKKKRERERERRFLVDSLKQNI